MKKLALALVCLMGVAFFASCDPDVIDNPEPSIVTLTEEGYLTEGQVIDMGVEYLYGFRAASNPMTLKNLAKFVVTCDGTVLCDSVISGTEFEFVGSIYFTNQENDREIVGEYEIIATVTDEAGKTNSASIKISLNEEEALVPVDFTWNRHGGQDATGGLEDLGLEWNYNAKEIYAVITPKTGATMYRFDLDGRNVWNNTVTVADKAALFADETLEPITELREVSCTAPEKEYDIVIGTVYNENTYLIHITKSTVFTFKGTDVTIEGQVK